MLANKTVDIGRFSPRKLILVAVFYQLLLSIGYPILLGRFKLGNEVLNIFGTASHIYWAWNGWRLHIGSQKLMLSRDYDGTS